MTLADLLKGLPDAHAAAAAAAAATGAAVADAGAVEISEPRDDSRTVTPGDLFVSVKGTTAAGRGFLVEAIARQAAAIVVEAAPHLSAGGEPVPAVEIPAEFQGVVVTVSDTRQALAAIAANRYPEGAALTLSAVTGTNGKTTTTYLVESMLAAAGIRAGVVGTITYRLADDGAEVGVSRAAPLTTPGALMLHALFADMRRAGASDVVLEASSQALDQARLDGCRFRVAGLTNLTRDHLDYHGSMERYFDAKAILFERLLDRRTGVAVLPLDLPEGRAMRERLRGQAGAGASAIGCTVLGISATPGVPGADVVVESVSMSAAGIRARIATPVGTLSLRSPLVGDYNLANIVLAAGMGIARGLDAGAIVAGVEQLRGVPGRLERVANQAGVLCVVDYAHTPDALERALVAVRPLVAPGGRLISVFGCGGDRDRSKRPLMGKIAAAGSDLAIVTSDNPRGEDPQSIIAMILAGMRDGPSQHLPTEAELDKHSADAGPAFHVAADRRTAIQRAVAFARAGDVLLVAGKGHEDYQIVGAERLHFDDREEAGVAFAAAARSRSGSPP